jgi:hypothetical protein
LWKGQQYPSNCHLPYQLQLQGIATLPVPHKTCQSPVFRTHLWSHMYVVRVATLWAMPN